MADFDYFESNADLEETEYNLYRTVEDKILFLDTLIGAPEFRAYKDELVAISAMLKDYAHCVYILGGLSN